MSDQLRRRAKGLTLRSSMLRESLVVGGVLHEASGARPAVAQPRWLRRVGACSRQVQAAAQGLLGHRHAYACPWAGAWHVDPSVLVRDDRRWDVEMYAALSMMITGSWLLACSCKRCCRGPTFGQSWPRVGQGIG